MNCSAILAFKKGAEVRRLFQFSAARKHDEDVIEQPAFISIFRELAGLFVDDSLLALAIGIVIALAAVVAAIAPAVPLAPGVVLLAGCLGVLFGNVLKARKG